MLSRSVSFGDAVLLVVGLPVSPLAVFAAVEDEATSSASQKLGSTLTPFGRGTVAANISIGFRTLLIFLSGHHDGQDGDGASTVEALLQKGAPAHHAPRATVPPWM